jgi:tetratricopeptide (TPR) repeat protein
VLERGAVIGKEFRLDDVASLLDPEVAPTAGPHVITLTARGFVRPVGSGEFAFRHVLLQEAVYRAAPKRLRAELHERFIDRFEERRAGAGDVDEFAGYHLEQAYRLRRELGESDRRTAQLGEDAGRRLGDAGIQAAKRADAPASASLLRRATSIADLSAVRKCDLLSELGIALRAAGDLDGAVDVLDRAAGLAATSGDRKAEARARMERAYARVTLLAEPGDELLDAISAAIPLFEATADDRLLGRAWLLAGWMHGGRRGQHRVRLEAAETALVHYRRSSWPVSTAVGEIASALYYGPSPVHEAIDRCEELLGSEDLDLHGRANLQVFLGGQAAQTGDFVRARSLIASATAAYDELGQRTSGAMLGGMVRADVELLARDDEAAEEVLRRYCSELEAARAYSHLASVAGTLAEALYRLDRLDDALEWTEVGERHSAPDDVDARVLWMPVRAKTLARRRGFEEAAALVDAAVELARTTDTSNRHAKAERDRGEVLTLAARPREARVAFGSALELYEAKGNVVEERRLRELLDGVALV